MKKDEALKQGLTHKLRWRITTQVQAKETTVQRIRISSSPCILCPTKKTRTFALALDVFSIVILLYLLWDVVW